MSPDHFVMRRFPHLESLTLVADATTELATLNTPPRTARCVLALEAWYAKEQELKPHLKIPRINVQRETVRLFKERSHRKGLQVLREATMCGG